MTSKAMRTCRGLIQATLHLVNREYAALADDFITLGLLPPGSDRAAIVPALTAVFQVGALAQVALHEPVAPHVFHCSGHIKVYGVLDQHRKCKGLG